MYQYFQPLMISMSPSATYKIVDRLTSKYDVPVKEWADEMTEVFKVTESKLGIT